MVLFQSELKTFMCSTLLLWTLLPLPLPPSSVTVLSLLRWPLTLQQHWLRASADSEDPTAIWVLNHRMPVTQSMNEIPHPSLWSAQAFYMSVWLCWQRSHLGSDWITWHWGTWVWSQTSVVSSKSVNKVSEELTSPQLTAVFACLFSCAGKDAAMVWDSVTWPWDINLIFEQVLWRVQYNWCVMKSQLKDLACCSWHGSTDVNVSERWRENLAVKNADVQRTLSLHKMWIKYKVAMAESCARVCNLMWDKWLKISD